VSTEVQSTTALERHVERRRLVALNARARLARKPMVPDRKGSWRQRPRRALVVVVGPDGQLKVRLAELQRRVAFEPARVVHVGCDGKEAIAKLHKLVAVQPPHPDALELHLGEVAHAVRERRDEQLVAQLASGRGPKLELRPVQARVVQPVLIHGRGVACAQG